MNEDSRKKWEDLNHMMSDGSEISLGECMVTATIIDGSVAIVISNMFGMGFDMVMPADLGDEIKDAIVSMAEAGSIDPVNFGEEALKKSFINGYVETLLPEITEELREMVSDIDPLKAVLSIMSYLNLLEWSMSFNDSNTVTLGPDGNIYVDSDEMPFSHTEIFEQVQRISGLEDEEVKIMIKWIPAACKVFDGVFPGYVCKDDGIGVEVTLISLEMSRAFSATVEDYWGDGPEDEDIDIDVDSIIDMVKKNVLAASGGMAVSKKPVEEALDMMDLTSLTPVEKDTMRATLLNVYNAGGSPVPTFDAIPDIDIDSKVRISNLIDDTRTADESFPFMCIDGGIVYTG